MKYALASSRNYPIESVFFVIGHLWGGQCLVCRQIFQIKIEFLYVFMKFKLLVFYLSFVSHDRLSFFMQVIVFFVVVESVEI